jgi:hypothetical protein
MSSIAITPSATGTGTVTLAAPVTNTNRTINLPDSTDTLQTIGGVLTQFNASGSAPVYAARAWVNFNGTNTVAIRASGNVSSITDNGTGDYTVNFTTAMPDANYSVSVSAGGTNGLFGSKPADSSPLSTSSVRIVAYSTAALLDGSIVCISIFR